MGVQLSWLVILLVFGGVVLGSYAWQTRIDLWPRQAQYRFPAVAIIAAAVGLVVAIVPIARRTWVLSALGLVGGGFVSWMFLSLLHESVLGASLRWLWIVVSAVVAGLSVATLERVVERVDGWRGGVVVSVLAGLLALGATMSFANAPLILGPVAMVSLATVPAAVIFPGHVYMRGVGATAAIVIVGVVVFANWFGDRERWVMYALLVAAPLSTGLCLLPRISRRGATLRLVAAALPAVVIAGIQAARAIPPLIESMSQSDGGYDY